MPVEVAECEEGPWPLVVPTAAVAAVARLGHAALPASIESGVDLNFLHYL